MNATARGVQQNSYGLFRNETIIQNTDVRYALITGAIYEMEIGVRKEDLAVKRALQKAGLLDNPVSCRGDLYWAMTTLMQAEPIKHVDLVDRLREVLSSADALDTVAELAKLKELHKFIKGCPDCGARPAFLSGLIPGTGEGQVACLHETDVTMKTGETLAEAIANWNGDDWCLNVVRVVYEITG